MERRRLLVHMKTDTTENNKTRFDQIIDDIEAEMDIGMKLPALGTVVKAGKMTEQLEELRKEIYLAIEESQKMLAEKEKFMADARREAEEIVRRRELELSKQPVLQEAEGIAKNILLQAKKEANRMNREAEKFQIQVKESSYKYADMIYNELESKLNEKRLSVSRNREDLRTILDEADRKSNIQNEREENQQLRLS